ncbi:MAG TPA: tetratricopeptide repeat protein [Candidatus Acidoferrales bacterium]|jgi:TolA-binding protein
MTRLAFIASLLLILSGALHAQQQQDEQQGQQSQKDQPKSQQQNQQQNQQETGQSQQGSDAPPAPQESSSKKSRGDDDNGGKGATPEEPPAISSDAEKAKAAATYNPLPAQQDIEVGTYYLHKGDIDAAIDRFLDAIQQRPNFAKPRLLLGKAYEKKHDNESAVKYYKEYLKVLPGAPDAKEVQKRIEKLSKE